MNVKRSMLSTALIALSFSQTALAETFHFTNKINEQSDTLVLFKSDGKTTGFKDYDNQTNGQLTRAISANKFDASFNSFVEVIAPNQLSFDRVLVVGLGDKPLSKAELTELGGNIAGKLNANTIANVSLAAEHLDATQASYIAHGINLRSYNFDKYKQEKHQAKSYTFDVADIKLTESAYGNLEHIQSGIFLARDLTNEVPT